MVYTDGTHLQEDYQTGVIRLPGEKGDQGIGFKHDFDMDNKRIYNLDTQDDHKVGYCQRSQKCCQ